MVKLYRSIQLFRGAINANICYLWGLSLIVVPCLGNLMDPVGVLMFAGRCGWFLLFERNAKIKQQAWEKTMIVAGGWYMFLYLQAMLNSDSCKSISTLRLHFQTSKKQWWFQRLSSFILNLQVKSSNVNHPQGPRHEENMKTEVTQLPKRHDAEAICHWG